MDECEFHCALCPEKCKLKPGHSGFCNCGGHWNFKNPSQPCNNQCYYCYEPCCLTGDHEYCKCERHKKQEEHPF
jgi:hypothetical protein